MDLSIKQLSKYMTEHPPNFDATDAASIIEAIYAVYNESNGMDNDAIKADFETLYARMHGYTIREIDKIIDVVCSLCRNHEKSGFTDGVKIGVRLEQELSSE